MQRYSGLNEEQVNQSRLAHGTNDLTPPKRESWVKMLLGKFNDPIIKLLLFATLLSLVTGYFHGSMAESFGIIIAVLLATFLSFFNEYKAGKEFDVLNTINDSTSVNVYRFGSVHRISKKEIVVGDVVVLAQGDEIPADGKLIDSTDMSVDESSLNGESRPSKKSHIKVDSFNGAYSPNFVYRGTNVTEGDGIMEVIAVGDSTEIGKTARQASELTGAETPLNKQLNKLSTIIGRVGFTIAGLTFIALTVRDLVKGILTLSPTLDNFTILLSFFMIAVTLIVVAVPEGLAMSVTLSLAYSMRKMTASNTLVRKMHACETMGATTVICTDKTGTLTQNRMRVQYCSFEPDENFAKAVSLNSTAFLEEKEGEWEPLGNPTEGALLLFLHGKEFDYTAIRSQYKVVQRLLFNTQRKYMATLADTGDPVKLSLFIKGAPEIIFSFCKREDPDVRRYQDKGMRSIAFAVAEVSLVDFEKPVEEIIQEAEFKYTGFVAIADPIRDDVKASMLQCLGAGIGVKIVTGDTSATAVEIARQAGLWQEGDNQTNYITGVEFEHLSDKEAAEAAMRIKVMSRARPTDKMRLVRLLQEQGQVVAVTGDGTNDAPALNYADVGLSMGSGTAVAKEASDIILLDDSFSSVTTAVRWGRSIYLNIQKFIWFQLTINLVALVTALTGPFIGIELPLTVTQMLWVNLIMDTFAALALASEPSYPEVMKNRPRGVNDFIITKSMFMGIFSWGVLFLVVLISLLVWFKSDGDISTYELSVFFTVFVMLQFWNMFNARSLSSNKSAFSSIAANKYFILISLLIIVLQFIIIETGGKFFRTEPISAIDWVYIIAGTSMVLWVGELHRYLLRRGDSKNKIVA